MFPTVRSSDPRAAPHLESLAARLKSFYATNTDYYHSADSTDKSRFYQAFLPILESLLEKRGCVSMLEFGAGRTQFPDWLKSKGLRQRVS